MRVNGYTPVVKEVKPGNFLLHRAETKMSEVAALATVGQELYKEAVKLGLMITGPVQWHYLGFVDESKPFTLEIALPVGRVADGYDGQFHFKRTGPFKSVSLVHEGDWSDLRGSYGKVTAFMEKNKLKPGSVTREVYINVDFNAPTANVTEIQMGIA